MGAPPLARLWVPAWWAWRVAAWIQQVCKKQAPWSPTGARAVGRGAAELAGGRALEGGLIRTSPFHDPPHHLLPGSFVHGNLSVHGRWADAEGCAQEKGRLLL